MPALLSVRVVWDDFRFGEFVELGDVEILLGGVALIDDDQHRLFDAAQAFGHVNIQWHDTRLTVDDEQDDRRVVDPFLDLAFDVF